MAEQKKSVVIKSQTFCAGNLLEAGKTYEVTASQAVDLVNAGRAVYRAARPIAKAESSKPKKTEKAAKTASKKV